MSQTKEVNEWAIGLTLEEYVELKLMPPKHSNKRIRSPFPEAAQLQFIGQLGAPTSTCFHYHHRAIAGRFAVRAVVDALFGLVS
ncbi:MAG TPA: hypothetical protein DDZ51_02380 [Planctomycetaceae bacterium]|nr:hypothetical protein [Planctomycetaceae bacterium]